MLLTAMKCNDIFLFEIIFYLKNSSSEARQFFVKLTNPKEMSMKVVKGSIEMKLAAVFVFFAAALLLSAGVSSRFSISSITGVAVAHAADDMDMDTSANVVVDNSIIEEAPVNGDMTM